MTRDDAKIMRYKKMREDSRKRFMLTGNKEHLEDMATLSQMVEIEMNKEAKVLGKVLLGMIVAIPIAIVVMWRMSYG